MLTELGCDVDDVFVGAVESVEAFPTEDGGFLFSEYQVSLGERFGGRRTARPGPFPSLVTIVRPGGTVNVDGVEIRADINTFPRLNAGSTYLFFARKGPTGAFGN